MIKEMNAKKRFRDINKRQKIRSSFAGVSKKLNLCKDVKKKTMKRNCENF